MIERGLAQIGDALRGALRAAWFLVVTLALGPGVVTNLILKDHWHRPRPIDVTEFGGSFRFTE